MSLHRAGQTAISMEQEIAAHPVDLVLHMGDLAYADGKHRVWESFMDTIEPISSRVPYMVGVGNHEYDYQSGQENDPTQSEPYHPGWGNFENDSGGECGVMIARRFQMPASTPSNPSSVEEGVGAAVSRRLLLQQQQQHEAASGEAAAFAAAEAAATVAEDSSSGSRVVDAADSQTRLDSNSNTVLDSQHSGSKETLVNGNNNNGNNSNSSTTPLSHDIPSVPQPLPPFWYSFDVGTVHFTITSTEHDITEGSPQQRWLRHDLASVDRCTTPWLLVGLHRPMYVVYPHKDNRIVGEHLLQSLEPLLLQHRVDATVSGHVHSYARTCSVIDGVCRTDESGIHHFVLGTGGHVLSGAEDFQQSWCEELLMEHGFGRFTVDGDEMTVQFVRSKDRVIGDQVRFRSKVVPGAECRKRGL